MKQYIGIIRDHSGSMCGLAKTAMDDFNHLIADIKKNAIEKSIDTIVYVMECGATDDATGWGNTVNRFVVRNSSAIGLQPISQYTANGASTPLYDAVGEMASKLMDVPDAADSEVSFLIMTLTDGEENSSRTHKAYSLRETIERLQRSDRWTFSFRSPRGAKERLARDLGVYAGNVFEWELSQAGLEYSTAVTSGSLGDYYTAKASGVTSTRSFFKTDMTDLSVQKVKANLEEITDKVEFYSVSMADDGSQIREFVENCRIVPMKKGAAFYQLTKREDEVQDYKQIAIRDKKTKKVYAGVHARQLLGLPFNGTVKIVPGNHGNYDIFIQSTSVNRKLVGGTQVMYWDAVGEEYKDPKSVKKSPVTISKAIDPVAVAQAEYIRGYREGFADGKAKGVERHCGNGNFERGYREGYKHGRGKKKNLHPA